MYMKKIVSMIVTGTVVLGLLTGCGADTDGSRTDSTQQESQSMEQGEAQDQNSKESEAQDEENNAADTNASADGSEAVSAEGQKTLVVYYSASGNTERVANIIADATGADLFSVEPAEPYSDADLDWTDESSRVSIEHENEDEREVELVSTAVEGWESYETVFIGYPIWWGIAAWPLDGFVKANDFTGKTVIPFCTSSSSDLGESGRLLADMAGTGEWQDGERFRSSVSDADVQDWVKGLLTSRTAGA